MIEEIITKKEARKANRKEMIEKGFTNDLRKSSSAKYTNRNIARIGKCLVCKNSAVNCICSGHMTINAMNRFFRKE
jgi:hypothetical protein